ncbi:DUF4097 family beta strand repeat-containing protein [Anoxybacterium hadale]|uniref:DUF4097 family beta strand repeat-containing protein n=1 Tax=Anoxybacterium hadale TaxID=3408580 RepID=UPI003B002E76
MKRTLLSFACAGILLTGIFTGCGSQKQMTLVNTLTFGVGDFQSLRLDYDADDIYVLEGDHDKVTLKEYMNEDKKSYYARSSTQNGELLITEGDRPRRSSFESYIEIYIPQEYNGSLFLHSTSGTIKSDVALNLPGDFGVDTTSGVIHLSNTKVSNLMISSTNGELSFENVDAEEVNIKTTNAAASMNQINGIISYQSKGGKLTATELRGSGSFHASGDGSINISFTDVTGDITAFSKNGRLTLMLPSQLAFKFSAITKEGSIKTSFADQLASKDHSAAGTIGNSPEITIDLETRNGDIEVSM